MVADSKRVSYSNVSALLGAGVEFIAPAPTVQVKDEVYATLDLAQATVVDWTPDREAGKPAVRSETYRVLEDTPPRPGPARRLRDWAAGWRIDQAPPRSSLPAPKAPPVE